MLALVLLHPVIVQGATDIVEAGDAKAADTNPGTKESPFKTISAAASKAQPGDEVLVRPGIYREAVTLNVSGEEGMGMRVAEIARSATDQVILDRPFPGGSVREGLRGLSNI